MAPIFPLIKVSDLVRGAYSYPSWSTGSTYPLSYDEPYVRYRPLQGKAISRAFPQHFRITPRFCYVLGLLKGEGANALGKSNYRRFTFTNTDPEMFRIVLEELRHQGLVQHHDFKPGCFHLLHFSASEQEVIRYWAKELSLPEGYFKTFNDQSKTTKNGVCHLYLSDVLLRRIIDLLQERVPQPFNPPCFSLSS